MLRRLLILVVFALALAPNALAGGGAYTFDGGTRSQQAQVRAALNASTFDWSVVPGPVVIHIGRGAGSHAAPGQIWLDASLLDSGRFAWAVVQHEYAHQVDFAVLTEAMRAQLAPLLGGASWWGSGDHASLTCERFADAVAWAYWRSPDNSLRPEAPLDTARFRAALGNLVAPLRKPASVQGTRHPRNG